MRTGDKYTTNTEDPRDDNDSHGNCPILNKVFEPIDQLAEEEQEGHLDGKDGDPAQDFCREGQLLVSKNTLHEVRSSSLLHHELARSQDKGHVEVNILEHDVGESEGSYQR